MYLIWVGKLLASITLNEHVLIWHLEAIEELQRLLASEVEAFSNEPGVKAVCQFELSQLHQLTDEQNARACAVARHLVLGGCRSCDHRGCRVLDLHLTWNK